MMETHVHMHVYQSSADFDLSAAEEIADVLNAAISERGKCFVALSGGETPRKVYRRLAMDPLRGRVKWEQVNLFFSDERCVPPTAPESNYGMAEESLISSIDIPRGNIRRMKGEIDPTEAATDYEHEIRMAFGAQAVRFDLVILGIGEDGHTASIFPGSSVIEEKNALVRPATAPDQKLHRLTLTFPCINNARKIIFLAAGKKKAQIVRRVLGVSTPRKELPATIVQPLEGNVIWLLDRDAASLVQSSDGQMAGSS